ncbi:N-acetylglucosamine-6-phosphate deacetylase [Sphingomonas sp. ST-64]|uniref:N-acetylglucosamine-6-phosphate deacetylase n=1 Tax=Sphingomonas plantiphila TaxID=3163295 RepID=A0ABW8YJW3_9SPHN
MIVRVVNGRIATPGSILRSAEIAVAGDRIAAIGPEGSGRVDATIDLDGGWLLPGFIDCQVNGGGGVLFNDHADPDAIAAIGAAHAGFGTTGFLPTLISDTAPQISAALDAVDAAIAKGVPGVVGIHIEGPFINEAKRGIHEAHRIRRLDAAMLSLLTAPRRGRVMLTLAPEQCAPEDIATLTRYGVIVSAGHSDATYEEAKAAIAAGLSGVTHLFNAMSPLHHRAPGLVGAALDSNVWCGLIVDDAHLHAAAVRIAVKVKGVDRLMLVTDAMPTVGTEATDFMLQGKRITVRDGVCVFSDGTLAGTHLDMASALRNTVEVTGLSVPDAATMASTTPARFLSLAGQRGALAAGLRADWVSFDRDLRPTGTWIGGVALHADTPALLRASH